MNLRSFISALSDTYAIEPSYGLHLAGIAYAIENGDITLKDHSLDVDAHVRVQEYVSISDSGEEVKGHLSIIEMQGPLFREDMFCGPMGMISISEKIKEFDADDNIDAHVIKMHTPGGQVSGSEILADAVAETEKPLIVWGEDILSAGKYIAAGASSIVLSGKNARVGSIGVQATYRSFSEMLSSKGVKDITIKASTSPDKNKFDLDNLSDEDKAAFAAEYLDPIDKNFMDHVRAHRKDIPESAMTGNVYFAEQALELGLADHIGNFEFACQLALDMAGKQQISISMKDEKTASTEASQELETLQAELLKKSARVDVLEEMISEKDKAISSHLLKIQNLEQEMVSLKAENDKLAQLPADDTEASASTPKEDLSTQLEDTSTGDPVPPAIQQAVNRGARRRQRELAKKNTK